DGGKRYLATLALLAMLLIIFMAQGFTNGIFEEFVNKAIDGGFGRILGLFREWARMSILLPFLIAIVLSVCISALGGNEKRIFLLLLLAALEANLISSPSWVYMNSLYNSSRLPDDYYKVGDGMTDKTMLFIERPIFEHNFHISVY